MQQAINFKFLPAIKLLTHNLPYKFQLKNPTTKKVISKKQFQNPILRLNPNSNNSGAIPTKLAPKSIDFIELFFELFHRLPNF